MSYPKTANVTGSHSWSDSLWGWGSGAMVGAVPSSSLAHSSQQVVVLHLRGTLANSLRPRGGGRLGFGSGCVLDHGQMLSRHLMVAWIVVVHPNPEQ